MKSIVDFKFLNELVKNYMFTSKNKTTSLVLDFTHSKQTNKVDSKPSKKGKWSFMFFVFIFLFFNFFF
jgi:hypothetical protein